MAAFTTIEPTTMLKEIKELREERGDQLAFTFANKFQSQLTRREEEGTNNAWFDVQELHGRPLSSVNDTQWWEAVTPDTMLKNTKADGPNMRVVRSITYEYDASGQNILNGQLFIGQVAANATTDKRVLDLTKLNEAIEKTFKATYPNAELNRYVHHYIQIVVSDAIDDYVRPEQYEL